MSLILLIICAANGLVGGLIGICGIAGFLLPMLYTGALGYSVDEALAYSFLAFLISGIVGSYNYKKAGNLDVSMSFRLGIGSFAGAIAGVFLQAKIPSQNAKTILYIVVLLSGISILYRIWSEKRNAPEITEKKQSGRNFIGQLWFLPLLGLITGAICSLSGAGGPVLVMPLLITFGVSARLAVGVALFDSVFIAFPACAGYLSRIDIAHSAILLLLIILTHGAGVLAGSRLAGKIPVNGLKIFVAVFSIAISLYMLL